MSPNVSTNHSEVGETRWTPYETDLGTGWIGHVGEQVVAMRLPGAADPGAADLHPPAAVDELASGLSRYFAAEGPLPTVGAAGIRITEGTRLRIAIYTAVVGIPVGTTLTYAEVAARVGRPGAARAVGAAMAENRFAPVVPCHRVVGSDSTLRGYAGGVAMKRRLLEIEAGHA
jgi:methylated-DNA-[protein]-cysteine S-methyltransferase